MLFALGEGEPMKEITVRFIVAVMLMVFVQGCSSVKPDPNTGPNSPAGQERERMDRMLNPSPNQ
jgi:hypothetical protein